jgi:MATE family multidrug resistance protein
MLDSSATAQPPVAPTLRVLLTLAWPVVLARATQSVIGFTDAYMVAPLGEAELAATTTGALDMFTVILFPLGMVFILQSFASQLRGRGELGAIRRYARYGLVIALAAGVVGLGLVPLVPRVIGLLGYEPAVAANMTEYVSVRLLSVGAAVGVEALGNWYGGLGNTRLPMMVSIVTMLANLLGNWLLISPRCGLPGYGVVGRGGGEHHRDVPGLHGHAAGVLA